MTTPQQPPPTPLQPQLLTNTNPNTVTNTKTKNKTTKMEKLVKRFITAQHRLIRAKEGSTVLKLNLVRAQILIEPTIFDKQKRMLLVMAGWYRRQFRRKMNECHLRLDEEMMQHSREVRGDGSEDGEDTDDCIGGFDSGSEEEDDSGIEMHYTSDGMGDEMSDSSDGADSESYFADVSSDGTTESDEDD